MPAAEVALLIGELPWSNGPTLIRELPWSNGPTPDVLGALPRAGPPVLGGSPYVGRPDPSRPLVRPVLTSGGRRRVTPGS
ncbi:hypothetical protein [Streptomyces olivaceoviridis]|uniref:hypothetical protein n=1 Tax=Streptomyces olivaceoviridis TaxID=1921 RepID=UPI003673FB74